MSYLEDLLAQQHYAPAVGAEINLKRGQAYASFFAPQDTYAPSYITPNAYTLAQQGYRSNEFAYAVMQKRALAKSQAFLRVMRDVQQGEDEEMQNHPLIQLLHNPNPAPHFTWSLFMMAMQITRDIAGFSAWEIEYSNAGEPLALWYMTPYFCSFLRGQQEPLRAIRYQPYGLAPMDIPFKDENGRPRILFFSDGENFDPLSDRVRFRSPMMAAFPQVEVDNSLTFFLRDFVRNGAKFAGLISVAQTIDENQAADFRRRWRAQHGGAENWSDPLILGQGASYSPMQMNFRDMAFPELDARIESRICNAFSISPIVVDARAGLDVSSYNNKKQAEQDWYYNWVIPSWKSDAISIGTQMLPIYESDPKAFYCEFDTSEVYALKEDRDAQVKRAVEMYRAKLATLDEARKEAQLPAAKEGGEEFFQGNPSPFDGQMPSDKPQQPSQEFVDAKEGERQKFDKFAKQRVKEGKSVNTFKFKYHDEKEQAELLAEFGALPEKKHNELLELAAAINRMVETQQPIINVSIPQEIVVPVPTVTNIVESKAAPITVQPADVTIQPAPKRGKAVIKKLDDGSFEVTEK